MKNSCTPNDNSSAFNTRRHGLNVTRLVAMVAPVQYAAHVPCLTVLRKLDSGFRLHEICVSGTCSKTCTRNFEHHRDRTPLHISNSRSYLRDKHMYSFRNNEGRKGIDPRAQIHRTIFLNDLKHSFVPILLYIRLLTRCKPSEITEFLPFTRENVT